MRKTSFLLFILGMLLLSSVFCINGNGPTGCCFNIYPRRIPKDKVKAYTMTDERCAKFGVIFKTKMNRSICVDPNMSWVQSIMKSLDEKSF